MSETKKERIVRLANSQNWRDRTCLATAAGVSREYVRLVIKEKGLIVRKGHASPTLLNWPCPECGMTILRWSNGIIPKHMPAHCRSCADKYCGRGHLRTVENTTWSKGARSCRMCVRMWHETVIGYRVCIDCGEEVPVTRNAAHQIRNPNTSAKGERCQPCRLKRLANYWSKLPRKKKAYCKYGHSRAPENLYAHGECKDCVKRRHLEARARKKAVR